MLPEPEPGPVTCSTRFGAAQIWLGEEPSSVEVLVFSVVDARLPPPRRPPTWSAYPSSSHRLGDSSPRFDLGEGNVCEGPPSSDR